jgi:glyoxylase-like metal-dependent hydrolase (beta-lactamase superfamily II)
MNRVRVFQTSAGRCIYCIPVHSFPHLITNLYVIDDGGRLSLVDCGTGLEESNEELLAGFEAIGEQFGKRLRLADLDAIIVTHGHIDHFGGLAFVRQHTAAPISVHPLDRRVLSNYEERVVVASRRLDSFLESAGVTAENRANLMSMYLFAKGIYRSTPVQHLLEEGVDLPGDIHVYHVPGHCSGQVCLQVDDVLLTADHLLAKTTPHQAPESITHNTGLGHYLDSLVKIEQLPGIRLGLGGHEEPMEDIYGRIGAIRRSHEERLNKVLAICAEPRSVAEISQQLFGSVKSYHVLLALEEAGAHVEYLYDRGALAAENLEEIEKGQTPVIRYQRV